MPTRLAVLGAPIAHSRSPALHAAAYRVLGLDWEYGRAEVTADELPAFLAGLDGAWRGLSLTMPLKRAVLPLVADREPLVDRLGLANTVLLGARPRLCNTDVPALVEVLGAVDPDRSALVLGAGATAASALEALAVLGAGDRVVAARDPARAAAELPAATRVVPLDAEVASVASASGVVVSTLPGGADAAFAAPAAGLDGRRLVDVAYDPWPTPLAAAWQRAGGSAESGLGMLIAQALRQVRVFVGGDQDRPLPDEAAVLAAMRAAVDDPPFRTDEWPLDVSPAGPGGPDPSA